MTRLFLGNKSLNDINDIKELYRSTYKIDHLIYSLVFLSYLMVFGYVKYIRNLMNKARNIMDTCANTNE